MERRNAWLSYTEAEEKELEQVAKAYRNFLNVGKTERECVTQIIREARAAGYESLEEKTAKGEKLKAGDKVYTVFNTGTPIPEEDIPNLWNKFYKVDKARTREYGGSGIGLSIVKAIIESMNQKYGVCNYDNGVEFWFTLDCRQ